MLHAHVVMLHVHACHIHNVHVPLNAFLCSAYKNICCIFCTCSGVKEPVNTVYRSCWERAEREGERKRECNIITSNYWLNNRVIVQKRKASQYKVHMLVSCTCTCTCYFKANMYMCIYVGTIQSWFQWTFGFWGGGGQQNIHVNCLATEVLQANYQVHVCTRGVWGRPMMRGGHGRGQ